jgi:hypothetical protein
MGQERRIMGMELKRCPHCGIENPNMVNTAGFKGNARTSDRSWGTYACSSCDGIVLACTRQLFDQIAAFYHQQPQDLAVDASFPPRAKAFFEQAVSSLNAPAGAVMLAASSVSAMLKEVGYSEGSLFSRLEQAADDKVISEDMVQWASWVGLDKEEDDDEGDEALPTTEDAHRLLEFAKIMGEWLFAFPERIKLGIKHASESPEESDMAEAAGVKGRKSLLDDGMDD